MSDGLKRHIQTLEERLNTGYALIDKRKEQGIDVTKLEDFWIQLLHAYTQAMDELREAMEGLA